MRLGTLAQATGTNGPTIRCYESIGLLPRPARQGGGRRRYGPEDVERLTLIRRCRDFGFSIDQVRALLRLMADPSHDCHEDLDLARARLAEVRVKLEALEAALAAFARAAEERCEGGARSACVVPREPAQPEGSAA